MNELLRFDPFIEYDDEDGHASMSVEKNGEYVSYEDAMKLIDDLQNRLDVALDCLDACHGMEMYWEEFSREDAFNYRLWNEYDTACDNAGNKYVTSEDALKLFNDGVEYGKYHALKTSKE